MHIKHIEIVLKSIEQGDFCFARITSWILLLNWIGLTFQEVSEPAAEALINLSQKPEQAAKMVAMGMIKTAMDILYKQGSGITRLLVMLLVNLTQSDDGIASLLQVLSFG